MRYEEEAPPFQRVSIFSSFIQDIFDNDKKFVEYDSNEKVIFGILRTFSLYLTNSIFIILSDNDVS